MGSRGRRIPEVLSKTEQKKLLSVLNERYFSGQRNKTMIRLMLKTGLRLSEVINLKWNNVDLMSGSLKVVEGKGRKDRKLYFGENTSNVLAAWKKRQSAKLKDKGVKNKNNLVFTTATGKKLAAANVRNMIYTYSEKAGIQEEVKKHYRDEEGKKLDKVYKEKKVSPHTLRHTFATELYKKSKDLMTVKKALGHSDISTTMIYTHLVDEDLENGMKLLDDDL